MCDPLIEAVVVMSSAQIGKTEILNNVAGYHIHLDPAPILLLQPTLEMAEAWSKDRFAPMLRDTTVLRGLVRDPRARDSGNTLLHKRFDAYAGSRLRAARKLRGMSQESLGKALPDNITFQQIQKYEKGTNRISMSRMYEFTRVLELPINYFMPENDSHALPLVTNEEALLLDHFRNLSPRTQVTLKALLTTLAGT